MITLKSVRKSAELLHTRASRWHKFRIRRVFFLLTVPSRERHHPARKKLRRHPAFYLILVTQDFRSICALPACIYRNIGIKCVKPTQKVYRRHVAALLPRAIYLCFPPHARVKFCTRAVLSFVIWERDNAVRITCSLSAREFYRK